LAKDGLTYEELLASVRRKDFSPTYLFYGEEDLLADEAVEMIIEAALTEGERGFNLDVVYGGDADARNVVSHAAAFPMMAERRVVVVREFDRLSNRELLSPYIEKPSPTTCLILRAEKPDFRKKPYVAARKHAQVLEFRPLYENQVPAWIASRVKKEKKEISVEACKLLASYIGTSLREIQREIEKLLIYSGDRKSIEASDVMDVVGISREYNVFELQKAIGAREVERAVSILERMLMAGESATSIIVMLTRFYTFLWRIHDMGRRGVPNQEQSSELGIFKPNHLKEYQDAASKFSPSQIEAAFEHLAVTDFALKSSGGTPQLLMHLMLLKLFGIPPQRSLPAIVN